LFDLFTKYAELSRGDPFGKDVSQLDKDIFKLHNDYRANPLLVVEVLERYLSYFEGNLVTKDINNGTELKIRQLTNEG
jgi:hypothetical protein